MGALFTLDLNNWNSATANNAALKALEEGKVIYLPNLPFILQENERKFIGSDFKLAAKSVKYSLKEKKLWGVPEEQKSQELAAMLDRFATNALGLVNSLLPHYKPSLVTGNSSFRPVEASGRVQSKRQDDRLLHIDAFPSRPNGGERILRVFTNINPNGRPREWRVGEDFGTVAEKFMPEIAAPLPGSAELLKLLKITKSKRTPYDHYMLRLHDKMKLDDEYQKKHAARGSKFRTRLDLGGLQRPRFTCGHGRAIFAGADIHFAGKRHG